MISAWLLYQREGGLESPSSRLLFWGLLLTGVHALDYPLLRPHPTSQAVGAAFSGAFTLAFGLGIVQRAWQRTRIAPPGGVYQPVPSSMRHPFAGSCSHISTRITSAGWSATSNSANVRRSRSKSRLR